jgi:hypothetical protein
VSGGIHPTETRWSLGHGRTTADFHLVGMDAVAKVPGALPTG